MSYRKFNFDPSRWFAGAILLLFSLGCASTGMHSERDRLFRSGLKVDTRFVNLPANARDQAVVVFVAEIRYADLQFIKTDSGYAADVVVSFSLADKAHPEKIRLIDRRRHIELKTFGETIDPKQYLRVSEQMTTPVGDYVARGIAYDNYAQQQGVATGALHCVDYLSEFSMSEPVLSTDSLAEFQVDKLIPLAQRQYTQDFYALVIIGGVTLSQPISIAYKLQDGDGRDLFSTATSFSPTDSILFVSLPIPSAKLAMGTTHLNIVAKTGTREQHASCTIYGNLGNFPKRPQDISALIEPMRDVMEPSAWQALKKASPEERAKLFKKFWDARQPVPGQVPNPVLAEFFLRLEEANARFRWSIHEGWKTDRGRILIIYGPPDNVENRNDGATSAKYEIWNYEKTGRRFVFEDTNDTGDFRLISSTGG